MSYQKVNQNERTRLESVRSERGMSRADLAALSGTSYFTIYRAEKKGVKPRKGTLYLWAAALDVLPSELEGTADATG